MVETFGTEKISRAKILELIREHFDLRPGAFREYLAFTARCIKRQRPTGTSAARTRIHMGAD